VIKARTLAPFAWCVAGLVVFLVAASVRLVAEGRAELAMSDACSAKADSMGAIAHARAAAAAYVPGASHQDLAYRKLRSIAEESEAKGDTEAALFAWRSIRAASIGSRSLFTPRTRERETAGIAVARLSAALQAGTAPAQKAGGPTTRTRTDSLSLDLPPQLPWSALVVAGVALWVAGGVWLTARGWDGEGRLRAGALRKPLALAVAGAVVWLLGLWLA